MLKKYFIQYHNSTDKQEVTKQEYLRRQRIAGYYMGTDKNGNDITVAFFDSSNSLQGWTK